MRADVLIRHDGFKALFDKLDPVEAERFIVMVRRDNFDYTEWQKNLWEDLSIEELSQKAPLQGTICPQGRFPGTITPVPSGQPVSS